MPKTKERKSKLLIFFIRQHFCFLHTAWYSVSGSSSRCRHRIVIIREKLGLFKCSYAQIARFRFSRSRVLVPRCTYCTLRGRNFCICLHKCSFLCCVSVRSLLHPLCKQSGCGYFLYFCCRIGCILLENMSYVNLM